MKHTFRYPAFRAGYQAGVMTTFTGVLMLVLLTLMMFFAIRVGVFEQRVSSNEMRQKLAFHAAESGIHHAKEYLRKNGALVASSQEDILTGSTHGWLSDTSQKRWLKCPDPIPLDDEGKKTHPCWGESVATVRPNTYFYSFNGSTALPVDTDSVLPGLAEEVNVEALLCVLDLVEDAEIPVQGCSVDSSTAVGVADGTYFLVTLLARGGADCDGGTCVAEALVSEQVSNFGAAGGGNPPGVPLTTKSSFPPSGTAEVVPNPNAGGVGVPISVWMNGRAGGTDDPFCVNQGQTSAIDPSSGSWATCEMHEWYGTDILPDDYACPGTCSCTQSESISYTHASNDTLGIDLVQDPEFPCDLFQFYFGIPRSSYEIVKGYSQIINNCNSLGPDSFGIYWVTGSECRINSNTQVGSPKAPVMLISAATLTRLNGGAKVYGTLFVTDVEDSSAELQSNGTNTIYGSAIVDGILGSYQGTFQVVWNDNTARMAGAAGGLGSVPGGWADFHSDWE